MTVINKTVSTNQYIVQSDSDTTNTTDTTNTSDTGGTTNTTDNTSTSKFHNHFPNCLTSFVRILNFPKIDVVQWDALKYYS